MPAVQERDEEITQPILAPTVDEHYPNTRIRAAARTDPGRVRSVNEDDVVSAGLEDDGGEVRTGLYAVADGMGGHDKGEVASHTAIEAMIGALESNPFFTQGQFKQHDGDEKVLQALREAVESANRAVYGKRMDESTNMGTTLVLSLVLNGKAYLANVGDSRAYLLRDGNLRQITEDHSLVERMIANGQITEAEARRHPQRNLVFRSLGTEPNVDVDLFVERLKPGDRLLLCSDGLSNMVPEATLIHIASRERNLDIACRKLFDAANEAGGKDNISVVLAEVLSAEE